MSQVINIDDLIIIGTELLRKVVDRLDNSWAPQSDPRHYQTLSPHTVRGQITGVCDYLEGVASNVHSSGLGSYNVFFPEMEQSLYGLRASLMPSPGRHYTPELLHQNITRDFARVLENMSRADEVPSTSAAAREALAAANSINYARNNVNRNTNNNYNSNTNNTTNVESLRNNPNARRVNYMEYIDDSSSSEDVVITGVSNAPLMIPNVSNRSNHVRRYYTHQLNSQDSSLVRNLPGGSRLADRKTSWSAAAEISNPQNDTEVPSNSNTACNVEVITISSESSDSSDSLDSSDNNTPSEYDTDSSASYGFNLGGTQHFPEPSNISRDFEIYHEEYEESMQQMASNNFDEPFIDDHSLPRGIPAANSTTDSSTNTNIITSQNYYQCPICFESARLPTTTHCGHIFCGRCIYGAMRASSVCPICKSRINYNTLVRLYI